MRHVTRLLPLVGLAPLAMLPWLGCEVIAGIEDRTFEPPPTESPVSPRCASYCADVLQNCTGEDQVYSTLETCQGVCALLDEGDPLEPSGNTVACRANQAKLAASTGEPAVHCPRSGPGGDGVCGSDCESYCALHAAACSPELERDRCVAMCAGLRDAGRFDVVVDHDGDTLQCRLVHVSSATVSPEEHCAHARLVPTSPCADADGTAPSCDDYCQVVMTSCAGDQAVYESTEQCLAVCASLPPGAVEDRTENTVGCRKYHAYSAMLDPDTHCGHAGPGGDGHCGAADDPGSGTTGNCDSYCMLLEAACKTEFDAAYGDYAACDAECVGLPGAAPDSGYAVAAAEGPTLGCRLLHISRAFGDETACGAALGGTPCD